MPAHDTDRPEIPSLTGLRYIAALAVALAHTLNAFGCDQHYWPFQLMMNTGAIGMSMFFVLSGFIMHYNYYSRIRSGGSAATARFLFARFARLYPLYALVLLAAVCWRVPAPSDIYVMTALPFYVTLTQSWLYKLIGPHSLAYAAGYFTDLTWSISTEWFFYLCLPLLVLAFARLRSPRATMSTLVILICASLAALTAIFLAESPINSWAVSWFGNRANDPPQDGFFRWLVYISPYFRLSEFLLGCLVSHLVGLWNTSEIGRRETRFGAVAISLAIAGLTLLLAVMCPPLPASAGAPGYPPFIQNYHRCFGFAVPVAVLIFCLARYDTAWSRLFSSRHFIRGGNASYSIYLLHMPLLAAFRGGSTPAPADWWGLLAFAGRVAFVLTFIVTIAYGVFLAYEAPARQWLRRLYDRAAAKRSVPVVPVAGIVVMGPAVAVFVAALISAAGSMLGARDVIHVVDTTYGRNCRGLEDNATVPVQRQCDGSHSCDFAVRSDEIGDPAGGCRKTFWVRWRCGLGGAQHDTMLPPGADFGTLAHLSCP